MYFNQDENEVLEKLNTKETGLSEEEARMRLLKYGKNVLPSKKRESIFSLFFKEFLSPIEMILVITVIISFCTGEVIDACVIAFIILVDVLMGTYQENKALNQAEALSKLLKMKAKVLRDGVEKEIDSTLVVVGDILLLESGSKLSADCRILACHNLQVDESILTGESISVVKSKSVLDEDTILAERKNMLYTGTSVMTGRAKAVVVATSLNTEIGKIASHVNETKQEKSPLTIRMEKFSKQISILILIISVFSAMILWMKGYPTSGIFLSVVALAVSAMPEGLPLALTMALTIASSRMSKKKVIVKNLYSVESLGSCTVIASDKTGTLTVNEQTAKKIVLKDGTILEVTGIGYNGEGQVVCEDLSKLEEAKKLASLCLLNNEAHLRKREDGYEYYGDSIDIAFLSLAEKLEIKETEAEVARIPYESEKQYSAVFYEKEGILRATVKGSLEKVMSFSDSKDSYLEQNELLSKEGYRMIAVCDGVVAGTEEKDLLGLEFLGMVAFIDPIRKDAISSLEECKQAGIKVVMITGDHPFTAFSIAKELQLATSITEVATGKEIDEYYQRGEADFDEFVKDKKVFSRVTPTDKLHIVESYKRMGEFIAVTGDGVNDAPAIKAANIGISMGSGTEVAKDTASMIVLDDSFQSIVSGVKEGRIAYANIRKITLFLLSCGMAEVLFYLLAVLFNYPLPLLAIQLLWINVVTDGLQDIALSFETSSDDIMKEKPRNTKESLFNKDLMLEISLFGFTIALIIFLAWKNLMDRNINLVYARSIIMMLMVFIQNIHVLNCRSEKNSLFKTSLFTNPLVIGTISFSILLQVIVTEIPLTAKFLNITGISLDNVFLLAILACIILVVAELYKVVYRRRKAKS